MTDLFGNQHSAAVFCLRGVSLDGKINNDKGRISTVQVAFIVACRCNCVQYFNRKNQGLSLLTKTSRQCAGFSPDSILTISDTVDQIKEAELVVRIT